MFITQFILQFITMKKMGRPRRENKVVMTTVSIPEKIFFEFTEYKLSQETWGDFFNKFAVKVRHIKSLEESNTNLTKENEFLIEAFEKQSKRIQELEDILEATNKEKVEIETRVSNR